MPRKDLTTYPKKVGYKKHAGMVAWLLHRVSGVALVLYFAFHILGSSGVCSFLPAIVQNIAVKSFILLCILFHGFNGFRVIFMEFCNAAERSVFKKYIYLVAILTIVVGAYGISMMF